MTRLVAFLISAPALNLTGVWSGLFVASWPKIFQPPALIIAFRVVLGIRNDRSSSSLRIARKVENVVGSSHALDPGH